MGRPTLKLRGWGTRVPGIDFSSEILRTWGPVVLTPMKREPKSIQQRPFVAQGKQCV
jgi:hypothetical protein